MHPCKTATSLLRKRNSTLDRWGMGDIVKKDMKNSDSSN